MANIMTVESSLSISWLYREILQDGGHRVFCVMRGKEAVTVAQKEDIDVVIVDERVSAFEGEELLEELRRLHPRVRAILCTWSDRGPFVDARVWDEIFFKNDNFTVLQGKVEGLCKEYPDTFSKLH
jgi:response regulator RpfG family c-di-GMP phosphodiesterase